MNFEAELIITLKSFRDGVIDKEALKAWVSKNESSVKSLIRKPGLILKIKHGELKTITSLIAQYSGSGKSDLVYKEGPFRDLADFEKCESAIADAISKGIFKKVPEPSWFRPPSGEIGAAAFYESTDNGSIWNLVIPERASRGYWKKIA